MSLKIQAQEDLGEVVVGAVAAEAKVEVVAAVNQAGGLVVVGRV